ncbi:Metalloprotease [Daldinia caldariorum]|uniref:Metalloprotease n=1 Tax=Daldinia caldariorum TaxID=326644 RepID=UPI002008195E|nr:Metalloprotease [Daldinia caldariorum]KAI1467894.1 Metalloprotease [Daldinia caldariorum]
MYPIDQSRNYYRCSTQKNRLPVLWQPPLSEDPSDSDSIVVGMGDIVPRWDVSGSNTTLEFFVRADTFPSADDASHAAQMKANFDLVYRVNGRADQGLYAEAFFPHERRRDVVVTDFALSAKERGTLKNVFLHEIGHILGLRHEFALDKEEEGAVRFMEENPVSVMSYTSPPTMQEFYKLEPGFKIAGSPIVDFQPELRRQTKAVPPV